jgi:AbrB family looped-hinge helix DNA binding protein
MSKVTQKFQITLPPKVRASLNIMPGVDMGFEEEKGRFYLVKNHKADPIEKWRGAIRLEKTTDEIMATQRGYGFESID